MREIQTSYQVFVITATHIDHLVYAVIISYGCVEKRLSFDGILNDHFVADLLLSVLVIEF